MFSKHALFQVRNYLKTYVSYLYLLELHFLLYFSGAADDQWFGFLDSFTTADVSMILSLIIIPISKSLLRFISIAYFLFERYLFNFSKNLSGWLLTHLL